MIKTRIFAAFLIIASIGIGFFNYYSQVRPESTVGKFPFKLGLDLSGGVHLVYKADVSAIPAGEVRASMDALRDAIERRVNILNVSEPLVQVEQGSVLSGAGAQEKLIVELPGETDVARAIATIGATPILEFQLLKKEDMDAAGNITDDEAKLKFLSDKFIYTGLTGRQVEKAQVVFESTTKTPVVSLAFNKEGRELFAKITKSNIGNVLGIFLDGTPISLPVIRQEIVDGNAQISGNFTIENARVLVRDLNYGALPVPIELLSTQTVGASLGEAALKGSIMAGVWAFIIIAAFLILWYRVPGLVAVLALIVYTLIMLAIFKLVPVTLTAAGIAGFILSIGMAVDANILIFERMKEELAKGKEMSDAMHEGFARAWLSIRDSNISSIITGAILYYFGSTSIVTGFALVFVIGVLASMFTAITASRIFLYTIAPRRGGKIATFLFSNGFGFTRSK